MYTCAHPSGPNAVAAYAATGQTCRCRCRLQCSPPPAGPARGGRWRPAPINTRPDSRTSSGMLARGPTKAADMLGTHAHDMQQRST
eukprot:2992358-Prymnesium_polylepis.1